MDESSSDRRTDRLFVSLEAVDLASDFVWLCAVVETGPFADAVEYAYVNVIGWALFALNLARWLSVRRSRNMIRAAGLEGSRGARLREVAYATQQMVLEDFPMLVLSAYVAARLVVAGRFNTTWPLVTAVTMLISEATFVKFGRAISRAGIDPALDPIAPLLFLACTPPGLQDSSNGPIDDGRFCGVAKRFNDHGDGSIDEINLLLSSAWR